MRRNGMEHIWKKQVASESNKFEPERWIGEV